MNEDMDRDEASASAAAIIKAAAKESSPNEGIIPDLVISEALGPPAVVVGVGSRTGMDSPPTLIDLTLDDTDEEGDVAPSPASARFKKDGRLADFGMYAGSLREKRVPPSRDRPGDNMEEGDAPKAVTPPRGTKNKMNEAFDEERKEPEFYYFAHIWGRQMRKVTSTLNEGPPPPVLSKGKYQILVSELVTRKGKGFREDKMGNKYYKSYYLKLSDSGVTRSIELALLSIGDFESLTYEHGPHKTHSRLKLLVSPSCRPPDGSKSELFCFHEIPPNHFEVIEDNGHLGCGFIHPAYLKQLLGNSTPAQRVFAIQVRIIGPSSVGVAKGMLFVKEDLEEYTIQLPTSMVKVAKSKTMPLHTDVVLNILQCYPSISQKCMGRLLDDSKTDPSLTQIKALKPLSRDVQRVMLCKGVGEDNIQEYMERLHQHSKSHPLWFQDIDEVKTRIKHGNVVGVCDPTGYIPSGHVFLTGMGGMGERAPSEVFLTRYPCTEGKDGIVAKLASWRDMPEEAFQFLDGLDFGAVVFPLGDNPLPPTINDGDLDGDLYPCIWDQNLIAGMTINADDECLGEILSDEMLECK
ncbi:hypothetical protein ACHAW5_008536 [Stephanodiscus triporus]|uniref:RNA-dependent RNA polymerase n=1 Tax=Stephanodiscus triporus TaxID=2934178 RepID=A0ABD3NDR8_9STRA